jgi:hypothetical protein
MHSLRGALAVAMTGNGAPVPVVSAGVDCGATFESVASDTAVAERSLASTLWRINMESADTLDAYFTLATSYQNLFAAYRKRGINRNLNPNDKELIDRSNGQIRHYYSVGADAMRAIINALFANCSASQVCTRSSSLK